MLIKYHKKIEDFESKIQMNKKQHLEALSEQFQKLTTKYEVLLKEQ